MGFKKQPKVYRLRFEDPDMEGLVVEARSLPIGEFLKVTELSSLPKDDPQAAGAAKEMFRVLAVSLVSWNLENEFGEPVPAAYWACLESLKPEYVEVVDGTPVPTGRCVDHKDQAATCRFDGILGQELDFILSIITAWMSAMGDVNPNLPKTSSAGVPALEASLPMDSPSPNPPS